MVEEEVGNVVVDVALQILVMEEVEIMVAAEVDAAALEQLAMILLLATSAGCVAIWLVTVPKPVMHSRREVAMLALPKENFLNLGKKAQNLEDVVVQCTAVH